LQNIIDHSQGYHADNDHGPFAEMYTDFRAFDIVSHVGKKFWCNKEQPTLLAVEI
jgi:hypothetical protein